MRIAPLVVLAACWSGWKQSARVEDREPDSITSYRADAPAPAPVTPGPVIALVPQPCAPNAAHAAIQLSFTNRTTFQHDLCAEAERVLGRLSYLNALSPIGFKIEVRLEAALRHGNIVSCKLTMRLETTSSVLGTAAGRAKASTDATKPRLVRLAATDCVNALVAEVTERQIGPMMLQHAAGHPAASPAAPPTTAPAPTSPPTPPPTTPPTSPPTPPPTSPPTPNP